MITKPRFRFLAAAFFLLLAACSNAPQPPEATQQPPEEQHPPVQAEIPFLLYQENGEAGGAAKLGNWDLGTSQLAYGDNLYTYSGNNGTPISWNGTTLILNKQTAAAAQGADHGYTLQLSDITTEPGQQKYWFKGFEVTGPSSEEEQPVYSVKEGEGSYKLDLSALPEFADRRAYLANAVQNGEDSYRLVFTAAPKVFKPGESWIIVVDYTKSTSGLKAEAFSGSELPFGDHIVNPGNSLLDGDRLYVWRTRDFGYFDLKQQTFVPQPAIYKDIQAFIPDRKPNPNSDPQILPVGREGSLLVLYDPTVYFGENIRGAVVYAYDGETPAGKLLIKGDQLYVYDGNNKQVGEPQPFPYAASGGMLISFPK